MYAHELSAKLLGYVRERLSAYAGRAIDACVIGVPVNFDASQRHYTERAAELAGLRVLELAELNRSLAAATQLETVPAEVPWLTELSARMAGHAVMLFDITPDVKAADLLGILEVGEVDRRAGLDRERRVR